ncbi:MAG: hypothetical protein EAZ34_07335 [Polaromonas sp.]|nr:MAG: hypothetical protein EAZ34_07335 [Polaromonas sp.]
MTRFVHLQYATEHPGVVRVESAMAAAQHLRQGFSGTRALAKLLLSAIAAAVMVVAYQIMDTLAEGHMLVVWTGLWAAAFVALAAFASTTRHLAARIKGGLDNWSRNVAQARADERLWAAAQVDSRVMADLQNAMARTGQTRPDAPAVSHQAVFSSALLRAYQRNHL